MNRHELSHELWQPRTLVLVPDMPTLLSNAVSFLLSSMGGSSREIFELRRHVMALRHRDRSRSDVAEVTIHIKKTLHTHDHESVSWRCYLNITGLQDGCDITEIIHSRH